jgi:thermostable 8-oxoguanine DNA glycosylase
MIDVTDVTKFDRTHEQLEEFVLFTICVAGKTAKIQAKKLNDFLLNNNGIDHPFECIKRLDKENKLMDEIKKVKLGQYSRLCESFRQIVKLNLKTCTISDLENIKGIGPKTARFFMLHSRPNQKIAVLDTHILKYMGSLGIKVPKSTPNGKKYKELESKFIQIAESKGKNIADFDLEIWKYYSRN